MNLLTRAGVRWYERISSVTSYLFPQVNSWSIFSLFALMKFAVFFVWKKCIFFGNSNGIENKTMKSSFKSNLNMMQLECYVLFIRTIFQNPPNFPQNILIKNKDGTKVDKSVAKIECWNSEYYYLKTIK